MLPLCITLLQIYLNSWRGTQIFVTEADLEVCSEVYDWCVRACVLMCNEPWEEEVTLYEVINIPGDVLAWG